MEKKQIVAFLLDCKPDQFMGYADQGDRGVSVIGPTGQKFYFTPEQLHKGEIAAAMEQTLAEAVKAERQAEPKAEPRPAKAHAPEPRAERSPKVKTKSPSKTGKNTKSSKSSKSSRSTKNS